MWEDLTVDHRLVVGTQIEERKELSVAEEREKVKPDADFAAQDEGDDVEGHAVRPEPEEDKYAAATEEPPDVEGHRLIPKVKP
jgi:hypothetical protein